MTMEDVARFRERFIAQVDATQASALRHWCRANVVHATSHYSGFGMFEAALAAFLETDGRMPQLRVFHASDMPQSIAQPHSADGTSPHRRRHMPPCPTAAAGEVEGLLARSGSGLGRGAQVSD
jgi:hypothetical protein